MISTLRPAKYLYVPLVAAVLCSSASLPDVDKNKAIGGSAAPVRKEVFSSFDCTHCKDFHERFIPGLVKDYVVPGKAYLINRECPLAGHTRALQAAMYATAAARIGKYQEVADALFKTQANWVNSDLMWESVAAVLNPEERRKVQTLAKDSDVDSEVRRDI